MKIQLVSVFFLLFVGSIANAESCEKFSLPQVYHQINMANYMAEPEKGAVCLTEHINQMGEPDPTNQNSFLIAGLVMLDLLDISRSKGVEGYTAMKDLIRSKLNRRGVRTIAAAAKSGFTNFFSGYYASILAQLMDNRMTCVVLNLAFETAETASIHREKLGLSNLVFMLAQQAPTMNKENFDRLPDLIKTLEARRLPSEPLKILKNVVEKNSPVAINKDKSNPEDLNLCL